MRRRDPDDQQGWGDVPTSRLEHPFFRLVQVLVLAAVILYGLNELGLLSREIRDVRVVRVTGEDPIRVAASAAREAHGGRAETVVIVSVDALADGVAATGLAGILEAPILLNEATLVSPQTRDVIRELDTERAILIGGTSALNGVVERTFADEMGLETIRIAGNSRFDTAVRVAQLFTDNGEVGVLDGLPTALVVPAEDVATGLAAGGLAAGRAAPLPVLYSQSGALPGPTVDALARMGIEQVVTASPITAFDGRVITVSGPVDVADTATELREFQPSRVVIVPDGDDARALVGGPVAGLESGVIMPFSLAQDWLEANCGTVAELFVIAEDTVVTDADLEVLRRAATACGD